MQAFQFNTTPQVIFRPGAANEIGALARLKCGARPLLVTDPGLRRIGLCDPALRSLAEAGLGVTVFDAVEADPSLATVMAAVEAGRAAEVTGVIGFGGGSSLDVAKVVALLLGSGEEIDAAWGVGNAKGPRLPLILVPTTAGTGSEVTPVSIITVGGEEKRGVSSPILLPDVALLDPDLTLGLPAPITAATGIDAMVHAIEAYASRNANNNPLSKMLARQALQLLGANIETAVFDGANREARGAIAARLDAGGTGLCQLSGRRSPCARLSDRRDLSYPSRIVQCPGPAACPAVQRATGSGLLCRNRCRRVPRSGNGAGDTGAMCGLYRAPCRPVAKARAPDKAARCRHRRGRSAAHGQRCDEAGPPPGQQSPRCQ